MFKRRSDHRNSTCHADVLGNDFAAGRTMQAHGLMAGTKVASNLGWRTVDALAVGDLVLTFDNGMQQITELYRHSCWHGGRNTPEAHWPLIVPVGALDNRTELTLTADQGVLIESDAAAEIFGDPFAIVPAHVLVGVRGIRRQAPEDKIDMISVYFAEEEVIYVEGGTLIYCPPNTLALDGFLNAADTVYEMLSTQDAAILANYLAHEDHLYGQDEWSRSRVKMHAII